MLTSIVASMVVLSAVAHVEVRLPQQEVEVIAHRLRCDCNELLSDRMGQEALSRLLRMSQRDDKDKQSREKHVPVVTSLRQAPILGQGAPVGACPPDFYVPHHSQLYISILPHNDVAVVSPIVTGSVCIRAPAC